MKDFKGEILWLDPQTITPYPLNTKKHPVEQIDKLAGMISRFGFDVPIVVDQNFVIVKGHGRREAAMRLGLKEVPVLVRKDLTDAEINASRIADNKVAESPWDTQALKTEIATFDEEHFELTGFTQDELDILTKDWDFNAAKVDGVDAHLEGNSATIKVICSPEQVAELKRFIADAIETSGFQGVEIS